jgi:hypothetical protein
LYRLTDFHPMRYSIILHLQRRSACCTTRAGVAVSFTSTSATPLISPRPHAQLAHVDADHAVRTFIHVGIFLPPTCAWRSASHAASFLPHVRGSRVFVGWDKSNHPTNLAPISPPSDIILNPHHRYTILLMTAVDPSVLGRAEGGVSGRSITIHVADTIKTRPRVGP